MSVATLSSGRIYSCWRRGNSWLSHSARSKPNQISGWARTGKDRHLEPVVMTCLVVADIHLAGMSGIEPIEKLRGDGNLIAVILITARPSAAITARAQAAGAFAVVLKPFDTALILRLIEDATRP